MSAVHLYPSDFSEDIKERLEHPYKSAAPEYGVSLDSINQELKKSIVNYRLKSAILFFLAFFSFIIFVSDPDDNFAILIIALGIAAIVEFIHLRSGKEKARKILTAKEGEAADDGVDPARSNVNISGGYSPFVGAGVDLDSWSFTTRLTDLEDAQKPAGKVDIAELSNYIKSRIMSLGLDDVKVTDELFVNGRDVNLAAHLLPNGRFEKPVSEIDRQYILGKINSNEKRERYYKVARISMWEGQLIISVYYRFLIINDNLFTEVRFFLLPPLKEKYLELKNLPLVATKKEIIGDITRSVFAGSYSWFIVVARVAAFIQGGFLAENARRKAWRREVESNRLYNYGWENSLREKWSSLAFERYFQKIDKDVALKLVTGEILSSLQIYLSERNISTEQFSQTTTKIINEGVMISGGEIKADSFAVGKGAKIAKSALNKVKN